MSSAPVVINAIIGVGAALTPHQSLKMRAETLLAFSVTTALIYVLWRHDHRVAAWIVLFFPLIFAAVILVMRDKSRL